MSWNRTKIANRLGLSSRIQQIDVIDNALAALESSPLLREGLPKLSKRSPRKRDDYKCGNCGKKKRNHYCTGNENLYQEEFVETDVSPPKKRKKSFKPLTVLLLENHNLRTQRYLEEIRRIGETNIEVKLRYVPSSDGTSFCIFAEASWVPNNQDIYIGQLSDFYKELVKPAMDDQTLVQVELAPLEEMVLPESSQRVLMAQLTIFRNTSWRTKRLSEMEWINLSKRKNYKGEEGCDPGSPPQSPSDSESSSPIEMGQQQPQQQQQQQPLQHTPPPPSPLKDNTHGTTNSGILLGSSFLGQKTEPSLPPDGYSVSQPFIHFLANPSPSLAYYSGIPIIPEIPFDTISGFGLIPGDTNQIHKIQQLTSQFLSPPEDQNGQVHPQIPIPLQ